MTISRVSSEVFAVPFFVGTGGVVRGVRGAQDR